MPVSVLVSVSVPFPCVCLCLCLCLSVFYLCLCVYCVCIVSVSMSLSLSVSVSVYVLWRRGFSQVKVPKKCTGLFQKAFEHKRQKCKITNSSLAVAQRHADKSSLFPVTLLNVCFCRTPKLVAGNRRMTRIGRK